MADLMKPKYNVGNPKSTHSDASDELNNMWTKDEAWHKEDSKSKNENELKTFKRL